MLEKEVYFIRDRFREIDSEVDSLRAQRCRLQRAPNKNADDLDSIAIQIYGLLNKKREMEFTFLKNVALKYWTNISEEE